MLLGTRRRVVAAAATVAAAIALALVMSGRGCAPADSTPEGTVRAFVAAAHAGDKRAAWELLGPATRERLESYAESATQKVGGARRYVALDMLEVNATDTGSLPLELRVAERSDTDAVVEISGPSNRKDRVRAVRIGRKWRVELVLAPPTPTPVEPPRPVAQSDARTE